MKRIFLLLMLLSCGVSAQNIPSYGVVWKMSELRWFSENPAFNVIAMVNDYRDGVTGGIYTFCDTCHHAEDSVTYIGSEYNGWPTYPYMWVKISEVPTVGNMTSQGNKVLMANGVIPTWMNASTLISSYLLSYANGVITGTINPITGSPISDTVNISSGSTPTFTANNAPSRSISTTGSNNTFTPSATKWCFVSYTVNISVALIISALTCNGQIDLEYSMDAGSTWKSTGQSVSLQYTVGLLLSSNANTPLQAWIPPNALVRLNRSQNTNVTITAPTNKQYETVFN